MFDNSTLRHHYMVAKRCCFACYNSGMRRLPFEMDLLGLVGRGFPPEYFFSPEKALESLKGFSGEDFGYDARKWVQWGLENQKRTGLSRTFVRGFFHIPRGCNVDEWLVEINQSEEK